MADATTQKTAAKAASKTAARQATHATKNAEKATELVVKSAINSRDVRAVGIGIVGATVGHYAVLHIRSLLAKRRLQQEIDAATQTPDQSSSAA